MCSGGVLMNCECERLLAARYPVFRRKNYPGTIFGEWGFECGSGWLPLYVELGNEIERLGIDAEDVSVSQIKEKFWRLRIYLSVPEEFDDHIQHFIDELEVESSTVCELCGEMKTDEHVCNERADSEELMINWFKSILDRGNGCE